MQARCARERSPGFLHAPPGAVARKHSSGLPLTLTSVGAMWNLPSDLRDPGRRSAGSLMLSSRQATEQSLPPIRAARRMPERKDPDSAMIHGRDGESLLLWSLTLA